MIVPNILFKVISNDPDNQSMVVKYCRENASRPIDTYRSYNVSYYNLDFSSSSALIDSIRSVGTSIVLEQLYDEPVIPENKGEIGEEFNSVNLDEYIGKLFSLYPDTTTELNEIELLLPLLVNEDLETVMNLVYA